ncbi:MAG: hypothetical protein QM817_41115 [Archangium sp.]
MLQVMQARAGAGAIAVEQQKFAPAPIIAEVAVPVVEQSSAAAEFVTAGPASSAGKFAMEARSETVDLFATAAKPQLPSTEVRVPPPPPTARVVPVEVPPTPAPIVVAKPAGPSRWSLLKPILHESLGWFIGAFLILAGALYLIGDAWRTMTTDTRALTIFGLVEVWAVGFALWAAALSRKETTRSASASLRRIAALVAPLSVLALGNALASPLAWVALVVGSTVAAFLTFRAAQDLNEADDEDAPREPGLVLGASIFLSTVGLGLVPVLPVGSGWSVLIPAAFAAYGFSRGPRSTTSRTWTAVIAWLLPLALLATRFLVAAPHLEATVAGLTVAAALLAGMALELTDEKSPRGVISVVSISVLALSFLVSFAVPKPACILVCLLAAWTTWRHSRGGKPDSRRVWWLSGTYVFAYLAWQRIDQLVPPIVWVWWDALKTSLGYSSAPMPSSYAAVYQALFIAVGAVIAAVRFARTASRESHVWLRTSAIAAGLSGVLAMVSVSSDARPALVALPMLALPFLSIGIFSRRKDALIAGSGLTALLALTLQQRFLDGVPTMILAVVCALAAFALSRGGRTRVRAQRTARQWLAGTSLFAAALVTLVSVTQSSTASFIALVGASAASLLAARFLHRHVTAAAMFTTLAVMVRLQSPLLMALVALLLAVAVLLPRKLGRWFRSAQPAAFAMLVLAPLWSLVLPLVQHEQGLLPTGVTALVSALAALAMGRLQKRREWIDVFAILFGVLAVLPVTQNAGLLPGWSTTHACVSLLLLSLAASVHAVVRGRSWQGVMLTTLTSLSALTLAALPGTEHLALYAWPAVVVLASTAALMPALTVPVSSLLFAVATAGDPTVLVVIAVITALVSLTEEVDAVWKFVLNRAHIAWPAAITSFITFVAALILGAHGPLVAALAVFLPLVWMRATRQSVVASLGIPLVAAAGVMPLAPLLTVVLLRALSFERVRKALSLPLNGKDSIEGMLFVGMAACTAAFTTAANPSLAAWWALSLLTMGGDIAVVRVLLAAGFAGVHAELRPVAVGGLVAIAALTRHAPQVLRRVLGARSLPWVETSALLVAIAGAGLASFGAHETSWLTPVALLVALAAGVGVRFTTEWVRRGFATVACLATGAVVATLPAAFIAPVTLLIASVLLGAPVLLAFAGFTLGLDLHASLTRSLPLVSQNWPLIVGALGALALAMRFEKVEQTVAQVWRRLGRDTDQNRGSALYWAAFALAALALPVVASGDFFLFFAPASLLLLTPRRHEQGAALALLTAATLVFFGQSVIVVTFALASLTLALLSRFVEHRLTQVWKVAAWALSAGAILAAGIDFHSWLIPIAWVSFVGTAWTLLGKSSTGRSVAWGATGVAVHVVMGFVGMKLSTGAPMVLIFPWWSLGMALLALLRHSLGGKRSPTVFSLVALVELMVGVVLLNGMTNPREAVACVMVAGILTLISWRRIVEADDSAHAWIGQFAVLAGALAVRVVGAGVMPGLTEAWVLLGLSAFLAGLSKFLKREGRPGAGGVLAIGAWALPVLSAALVPWNTWTSSSTWLVGLSALAGWLAHTSHKRWGTLLATGAINTALVVAAIGVGFTSWHLLLIPFGLSLLALSWLFRDEVSAKSQILLRAWGMGFIYAAMAWEPLTANSVGALILCVAVCLVGIALGAMWRIRSFVLLGTGVLVTSVLATLVRNGLAEPRLGAVFLSLLGLLVVVVMVMISTKREELRARLAAMQRVMATWQ